MSVVIRMKPMGRKHRPYYRICATDSRNPVDGKVIEELGTYDPMIKDTDARVTFNYERLQYWMGVGAKPSDKVRVLIKKYGPQGTRAEAMNAARAKLALPKVVPPPAPPQFKPEPSPAAEAAPASEAEAGTEGETAAAEAAE